MLDRLTVASALPQPEWGSDVVAEMLRRLGVEYIALNPGASFRHFHDSLVNYLGNKGPGMILCNHEEIAVAIAHGYAKFAGKPMAAAVHANVGLMHASMGIFNAFADRVPVFVLGGNGPMDSAQRRPWIDWIHTTFGQGEVVRAFTKWEHQPTSIAALPEAMLRAWHQMMQEPAGPVYVGLDVGLQEQRLPPDGAIALPDLTRFPLPSAIPPAPEVVRHAASWLVEAEYPVILPGRMGEPVRDWDNLVELAEALGAAVLPDAKSPASFPTSHALCQAGTAMFQDAELAEVLGKADVVLALERTDVAGSFRARDVRTIDRAPTSGATIEQRARLINVSMDGYAVRSWAMDFQALPAADLPVTANVSVTLAALLEEVRRTMRDVPEAARRAETRTRAHRERRIRLEKSWEDDRQRHWGSTPISAARMTAELRAALGDRFADTVLARSPLCWQSGVWDFLKPGSYLGLDGGGGLGSGPGMVVGSAIAARASGRLTVGMLGDGDLFMAPQAVWTAAHHAIPVLLVVANNQSYFNDEAHQDRVARTRGRPPENRWLGQRMDEPSVDFAGLARSMGAEGFGPVTDPAQLAGVYREAVAAVESGRPTVVDVRVATR